MINQSVLVGRLTKDVELRYTPSNQAVATFTLAVNRNFKNQNGDYEADFINCVMWRQQAENLANWAQKGTLVDVTGRIQTRNYENQQGQRVYVTEVIANSFQILESRNNQQGDQPQNQGNYGNQGNFQNGERRTSYVRICAAARPRRAASCRGSAPGADEYFTFCGRVRDLPAAERPDACAHFLAAEPSGGVCVQHRRHTGDVQPRRIPSSAFAGGQWPSGKPP